MRPVLLALAGAALLGGCAGDMLTLSENEEGEATGAVAILDPVTFEERAVLNAKLTEAKLTTRPKPRAVKEVKPAYTTLFNDLPPKAESFKISFPFNETKIPEAQLSRITDIRRALERRPGAQIEVVGFTDTTGNDEVNDRKSTERAQAVVAELIGFGLPIELQDAVGRGERAAREAGNPDEFSNEQFRKVEVVVR